MWFENNIFFKSEIPFKIRMFLVNAPILYSLRFSEYKTGTLDRNGFRVTCATKLYLAI